MANDHFVDPAVIIPLVHTGKKYCQLWKPGRPDNNCDTNTDNVASFLLEKQVEASEPLYISANWGNVEKHRARTALESLAANGYKVRHTGLAT